MHAYSNLPSNESYVLNAHWNKRCVKGHVDVTECYRHMQGAMRFNLESHLSVLSELTNEKIIE